MLRALASWSARYRFVVLGFAAATVALGAVQLNRATFEAVPEFTPPYVEIQTEALGLAADEVEQLITVPLEADLLHGVAFLEDIRSESVAGLSSIVLVFEPGTDLFRARQVVSERLTQAHALPNVSRPPAMLQPLSSSSRVLMATLSSSDVSPIELSVLARWTVLPRLLSVPGVANVAIWGQRERQLQVLVDPERLSEARVLLAHVVETTGNALWVSPLTFLDASTPGSGGFIDTPNQRLSVQHIFPIRTPEDLAQVPIPPEDTGGRIVLLGDVAEIVEDHQPLIGDAIVNDGNGLLLVVEKFPGVDTLQVTRDVEAALAALQPGLGGVAIDTTVFRPATFVEEARSNVALALLVGFALALLVLIGFFRGWRAALAAALTIPIAAAAAVVVLTLIGVTINAFVVAGIVLAVAAMLDDAVVGTDAIARRLRDDSYPDASRSAAIRDAVATTRTPVIAATLLIGLVIVPLLFVAGRAAVFLPGFLLAYLLASVASIVVSLTVGPALAALLLRGPSRPRPETRGAARLRAVHAAGLRWTLARSRVVMAALAVVTIATLGLTGTVALDETAGPFVPSFRERDVLVRMDAAPGTSQPEMDRIVARATAELRAVPGIRNVGAHVGRAVGADRVGGVSSANVWVSVEASADYSATLASVDDILAGYPGMARRLTTYTADRMDEVLGETGHDIVVRVYGQELAVIGAKARDVGAALEGIAGISELEVQVQEVEPTVQVEVNLAAAEELGLRPGDVRRAAATLLSGIVVGSLFEDQKVFEVVVWGKPELRESLTSIRELPIITPSGVAITLGDVADVRIGPTPTVINREGVFRYLDVGATVEGRDLAAVSADVRSRLAGLEFPLEYRAEVMEPGLERQAGHFRVLVVSAAILVAILLLLQAAFTSWRRSVLVLLTLPAALVGAALGALLTGTVASIGVVAGFLGVLAFSARTALAMVDHLQRREADRREPFDAGFVLGAATARVTPVVVVALAAGAALATVLVLGDRAGFEILRPMAVVMLGGLLSATLTTLFVIPTVYLLAGPSPVPDAATRLADEPGLSAA